MPSRLQPQPPRLRAAQPRNRATELHREFRFGEEKLQVPQDAGGLTDLFRVNSKPSRKLAQQPMYLAQLIFPQPDKFVVQLNSLKRLHEHGLPAATGAVNHPVNLPLLPRDDGNHATVIANSNEI